MNQSIFALLVCLLPAMGAFAAPEKYTFTYSVSRAGQEIGETKETFEQGNGRYRVESTSVPKGAVAVFVADTFRIISEGESSAKGLRPQHFEYHRSTRPNKAVITDFDWPNKRLTARFEGKTETHPLPDNAQDRLSAIYQLRYWPKDMAKQSLPITSGKEVKTLLYKRIGDETVKTPLGTFRAVHFARDRTPDDDGIHLWVSDKFPAPVKIVLEDKKRGTKSEQVLTGVQREP